MVKCHEMVDSTVIVVLTCFILNIMNALSLFLLYVNLNTLSLYYGWGLTPIFKVKVNGLTYIIAAIQ